MFDYCSETFGPQPIVDSEILADIRYGLYHERYPDNPKRIVIGVPSIGELDQELWCLSVGPVSSGWHEDIGYVQNGRFMFAHLLVEEARGSNLTQVTQLAYKRLLAFVASSPYPELLRIWNYFDRINVWEQGFERYQAFCKGRFQAFAEAGIKSKQFPAATAIGSSTPGLSVHLLTGCTPGTPIENPRQVSAYKYPSAYGPRPPSFARGIYFLGAHQGLELAISGTASIIGHVSMHPHHIGRQLRETLRNLEALTTQNSIAPFAAKGKSLLLKVYLRHPDRIGEIAIPLRAWAGSDARIIYLKGDICRRELEIEIEAHCIGPHTCN